jgi:DNA-binding transcriptional ArsR family regulator
MSRIFKGWYDHGMRPFAHPSADIITLEGILHALSDPERMAIYVCVANAEAAQSCANLQRINERIVPKSTLSQHFRVLREAGLIRSERRGVEVLNTSRRAEIDRRFPGLLDTILTAYCRQSGKPAGSRKRGKRARA